MDRPRRTHRGAVLKPKSAAMPNQQYSPWAPLTVILDRLDEEGLLFWDANGGRADPKQAVTDFVGWLLKDKVEVGTDAGTGEALVRAPYRN